MSRAWRAAWLLCALLWLAPPARAHNPDTSYVRIAISQDRLALRFTLDLFTLRMFADLDQDGDSQITPAELQRARGDIERFLRAHVRLELDGQPVNLGEAGAPEWPRDAGETLASRDWHSAAALIAIDFQKPLARPIRDISILFYVFETFGPRHTVLGAFAYAGGSEEVTFTQTEPDYLFDTAYAAGAPPESASTSPPQSLSLVLGRLFRFGVSLCDTAYAVGAPPKAPPAPRPQGLSSALGRFFRFGVEHIFTGYDHICFLVALLVASTLRELVKIITSFTVAHSITLILAALQVVHLPLRLVECAIAATIVYVAVENTFARSKAHRWLLTFGFGLIHGFGFAATLSALALPTESRVRCLLAFNVGVEAAQLAIVLLAFPLVMLLSRWRHARVARGAINVAVGLFGVGWFLQRALGDG